MIATAVPRGEARLPPRRGTSLFRPGGRKRLRPMSPTIRSRTPRPVPIALEHPKRRAKIIAGELHEMPDPIQALVSAELDPGERVYWAGQPVPRPGISCGSLAPMVIAVPWTAFAVFWVVTASGVLDQPGQVQPGRMIFALFGVP